MRARAPRAPVCHSSLRDERGRGSKPQSRYADNLFEWRRPRSWSIRAALRLQLFCPAGTNLGQVRPRDRIFRHHREHATINSRRLLVVAATRIDLREIDANACGHSSSREGALIKNFRRDPIGASDRAANAERYDRATGEGDRCFSKCWWEIDPASCEKNKKSNAWKIQPVFRHSRVELNNVRHWQVTDDKPGCAENSHRLPATFSNACAVVAAAISRPRIDRYSPFTESRQLCLVR